MYTVGLTISNQGLAFRIVGTQPNSPGYWIFELHEYILINISRPILDDHFSEHIEAGI